jgi:hypothetical protein
MAAVHHKVFVRDYLENSTLLNQLQGQEPIEIQSVVNVSTQTKKQQKL